MALYHRDWGLFWKTEKPTVGKKKEKYIYVNTYIISMNDGMGQECIFIFVFFYKDLLKLVAGEMSRKSEF